MPSSATTIGKRSDVIGRQSLVLSNILGGDVGAAARAGFAPQTLSPEEARTIVDRMGLNQGPFGAILSAVTNPLVLLGAVLSYRFPVPSLKNFRKVGKQLSRAADGLPKASIISPQWGIKSALSEFADVEGKDGKPLIVDALLAIGMDRRGFTDRYLVRLADAFESFTKTAGRGLNHLDGYVVSLQMDGLGTLRPSGFKNWTKPGLNPLTGKGWAKGTLETPINLDRLRELTTPAHQKLIGKMRGIYDDVFTDIVARHPEMKAELSAAMTKKGRKMTAKLAKQLERGEGIIPPDVLNALRDSPAAKSLQKKLQKTGLVQPGEYLAGYWPHTLSRDLRGFQNELMDILQSVKSAEKPFSNVMIAGIDSIASDNLIKRLGRMLPDPRDLERLKGTGLLHPQRWDDFKAVIGEAAASGAPDKAILPYSLNLEEVTVGYVNRMASTYAFNVKGSGRKLLEGLDILTEVGDPRASILQNTVIPLAAGKPDLQRAVRGQWWAGMQIRLHDFLDSPTVVKAFGGGKDSKLRTWMKDQLTKDPGPFSFGSAEAGMTSLLYTSTLGLPGVSSAALNSLQTLLTTGPLLGKHAATGFGRFLEKAPKYLEARLGSGKLNHRAALEKVWPEFVEMGFGGRFRIADSGLDEAFQRATAGPIRKGWHKAQEFLMSLFEKTETMNQITAFEGGMAFAMPQALAEARASGLAGKAAQAFAKREAMEFSRWTVMMTQFPGGAENAPLLVSKLKGYPGGRLLTMFSQFAGRYMEFLGSTATRVGSAEKAGLLGRNWGTLGRAMLMSGFLYEMGQSVGVDMTRALMFGAMPEPRRGAPFYPFPFGGPAASIAGGGLMDLMAGEFDRSKYSLPLLVPGGVGAARLIGFGSEEAAKKLGRKYVDYDAPAPDGTYAVYSSSGEAPSLVGFMSPMQLTMMGLGIPGGGSPVYEASTMEWLVKNRDRIRAYKRDFLEAMLRNDAQGMQEIENDFGRAYPMPGGLRSMVKQSDIKAVQLRRNVTRLERVMDTLPKELRPMFAGALQQSILAGGTDFIGIDPGLLGQGTVRQRNAYRPAASGRRNLFGAGFGGQGQGGFARNRGGYDPQQGAQGMPEPRNLARHALPDVGGL